MGKATRSGLWVMAVLVLAALVPAGAGARQKGAEPRHVVLITIDGFGAYNLDNPRIPLPNLRQLAQEGTRADAMTVSTPSVTWPNHTTLVTGVTPARHGVLANGRIEATGTPPRLAVNPSRSKVELCQAPTIYDVAHAAGLKTAAVNWPVTREAPTLDWDIPDHPQPIHFTTPALLREIQAEGILPEATDPAWSALGPVTADALRARIAAHLIRRHQPHVLLIHFLLTDSTQHAYGPNTVEAFAALSLADRLVGDVQAAIREAGLAERTALFVTADHGFVSIANDVNPNARLRQAGLIRAADGGAVEYDAQAIAEGGVALVYVPGRREKPELVARTREALTGIEGVERIVPAAEYGPLGFPTPAQNPQAPDFLLAMKDGYGSTNAPTGDVVAPIGRTRGSHGYLPTNPKVDALFVAAGAGIRKGVRLSRVSNLDVAPTLAALLGVRLPDTDGKPMEGVLER